MSDATAGFLGKEVYVVITTRAPGAEITPDDMRDHLANQVRLEKEGIMFGAGPLFGRDSDVPQAGMIVIRANSFEEADEIAQRDPLHSRGLRAYTLQKWRINEGSYTLTVNYSDQSVRIQ
jgi:uncharacterized protein YciI